MAQGDTVLFHDLHPESAKGNIGNLSADTLKCGFITAVATPAATDALPHFGGTGTTDLSTQETSGGNVPVGGVTLTTVAVNEETAGYSFDTDNIVIGANASNPQAARWAIFYNFTLASNRCLLFLDLGSAQDLRNGFTITAPAAGWYDVLNV
jgi:hypothetical protein